MTTLFQKPIRRELSDLINEFGFFYAVNHCNETDERLKIVQTIGDPDTHESHFDNYAEAEEYLLTRFKARNQMEIDKFNAILESFKNRVTYWRYRHKLVSAHTAHVISAKEERFEKAKQALEKGAEIHFEPFTSHMTFPLHYPKKGQTYFVVDLNCPSRPALYPVEVASLNIGKNKYNKAALDAGYDYLCDSNLKTKDSSFEVFISVDNILQFDGEKYSTGYTDRFVFVRAEDAKQFLMAKREELSQVFQKAIDSV